MKDFSGQNSAIIAKPSDPALDGRCERLNKLQIQRAAARLLERQYAGEMETWDTAKAEDFISKTVRLIDSCTDMRAKAAFTKIVSDWMRLGKRSAEDGQQVGATNIQINIIQPAQGIIDSVGQWCQLEVKGGENASDLESGEHGKP
jgi:hypothetical protein